MAWCGACSRLLQDLHITVQQQDTDNSKCSLLLCGPHITFTTCSVLCTVAFMAQQAAALPRSCGRQASAMAGLLCITASRLVLGQNMATAFDGCSCVTGRCGDASWSSSGHWKKPHASCQKRPSPKSTRYPLPGAASCSCLPDNLNLRLQCTLTRHTLHNPAPLYPTYIYCTVLSNCPTPFPGGPWPSAGPASEPIVRWRSHSALHLHLRPYCRQLSLSKPQQI